MNRLIRPTLHSIPVSFSTKNLAMLDVEREEWNYHKGSDNIDATMEDCFPWKDLSGVSFGCSNICLPVIVQYLWKEKPNRPRCHKEADHMCMMDIITKTV